VIAAKVKEAEVKVREAELEELVQMQVIEVSDRFLSELSELTGTPGRLGGSGDDARAAAGTIPRRVS